MKRNTIAITDIQSILTDQIKAYANSRFPQYCNIVNDFWNKLDTEYKYSTSNALDKLFTAEIVERLVALGKKPGKNAFLIASGTSEWAGSSKQDKNVIQEYNVKLPHLKLINIMAGLYANKIGWTDYISSDATACISSYKGFYEAELLINSGEVDRVIVVGADDQINGTVVELFGFLNASLTSSDEEKGLKPSAFDEQNYGFRLGHGIGYIVFENEQSVLHSKNKPIAYLHGTSLKGEKHPNPFGQSEDGSGYASVINGILEKTSTKKSDITFIKTHGTGTKSNNKAERNAIESIFGDDFIATSYKPEIGHTLGSNGIVELSIAITDAKNGFIRGIKNRTTHDDKFLSYDKKCDVKNILCLASGMGNVYAASVISIEKS